MQRPQHFAMAKKTMKVKGKEERERRKAGRRVERKKKKSADVIRDSALALTGNEVMELQILREDEWSFRNGAMN